MRDDRRDCLGWVGVGIGLALQFAGASWLAARRLDWLVIALYVSVASVVAWSVWADIQRLLARIDEEGGFFDPGEQFFE